MIREPAVAGMFYPRDKKSLEQELTKFIDFNGNKRKVLGLVSPHAGYVYSGSCAGKGFSKVEIPDKVIILGVNHRGYGHPFAVDGHEHWRTPLGNIMLDVELRDTLVKNSEYFGVDSSAGLQEHSLEVQVPFIQIINPDAKILPVTISSGELTKLLSAGQEIGRLLHANDGDLLVVASTDMSHFIDADSASVKDQKAIDKIMNLDPAGLFEIVRSENISMCGVYPTVMMLSAAIEAGAKNTELVEYTHSGKVSGDHHEVVAYLSLVVL
jgi:AmmeMemoRadiSam system protein B